MPRPPHPFTPPTPSPRHDLAPTKRSRKKMAALECEEPERELKKQKRAARFQHGHSRRLRLEPLVLQVGSLEGSTSVPGRPGQGGAVMGWGLVHPGVLT